MPNTAITVKPNEFDEFFVLECWQEDRQPVLQEELIDHIQDGWFSCLPDCRNARKQDLRNAGKHERQRAGYPAYLHD